jgi:hypothetical protein
MPPRVENIDVRATTALPIPIAPSEGRFPTFAGSRCVDPIAVAQGSDDEALAAGIDEAIGTNASDVVGGTSGRGRAERRGSAISKASASGARSASGTGTQVSELEFEVGAEWARRVVGRPWYCVVSTSSGRKLLSRRRTWRRYSMFSCSSKP